MGSVAYMIARRRKAAVAACPAQADIDEKAPVDAGAFCPYLTPRAAVSFLRHEGGV